MKKQLFFVLFVFLVVAQHAMGYIEINETNFPDDRFRNYLLSQSYGEDGILTDDEIASVTKIVLKTPTTSATVSKMQNMKGIEYFTALKELDCSYNDIDTLDLSHNTLLEKLDCSYSGGGEILGLAGNKNLREVYCDVGYHKSLDLSDCTSLTTLICCTSCRIESLNISGCVSLVNLELPYGNNRNQWIYNLNASGCTSLKEIRCFKALIYTLDASGCTSLEKIECYENNLHEINVTGCTALKTLSCGGWNNSSYFTSLDLSSCTALEELSCGMSPLESLDLSNNRKLKSLQCGHTNLNALNISNCSELTELDCSWSNLTTLDVSNSPLLTALNCSNGQLTELNLSANTKLTSLICNDNHLTSLDLSNNRELETVYCQINQLQTLNVNNLNKLITLWCNDNNLEMLNVRNSINLDNLYCENNKLSALNVSGLSSLKYLSCSYNQLTSLNVSGCNSLSSILCDMNQLSGNSVDIFFASLPTLDEGTNYNVNFKNRFDEEGNECTKKQVAVANAKGWNIYKNYYYNWGSYEGVTTWGALHTWTVVGSSLILGSDWDTGNTANDMTLTNDGTSTDTDHFILVKENAKLEAGINYWYKIAADHSLNTSYPGQDAKFNVAENGIYTVTFHALFTADNEEPTLWVETTKTGEYTPEEKTWTIAGSGELLGSTWDISDTSNDMEKVADDEYQLTKKDVTLSASLTYSYKVVANHSWNENYGFNGIADGDDVLLIVSDDGIYDITFSFNSSSKALSAIATRVDNTGGDTPTPTHAIGDYIIAKTIEGVDMKFCVRSETEVTVSGEGTANPCIDASYAGSLTIPETVEGYKVILISDYAFRGCKDLTSVVIPDGVTAICRSAFSGCTGLSTIVIPSSVSYIGDNVFSSCSSLTSIDLSKNNGIVFGRLVFVNCTALKSVVIPDGTTDIGDGQFSDCSSLTTVSLPQTLKKIGVSAFYKCTSLSSANIPNGTETIGEYAYLGSTNLAYVHIPNSVNSIGDYAFAGCDLSEVIAEHTVPLSVPENTFVGSTDNATLYVPAGCKAAYEAADYWNEFKEIVEMEAEPIASNTEHLSAEDVEVIIGQTALMNIDLINDSTNLTAYQFDLTLPEGVSIAKDDKGKYLVTKTDRYDDDNQNLTVSLVDDNTYRFVCFSLTNALISGTSGSLLEISLSADENIAEGSYEAQLSKIVFTEADGTQLKLEDATFNIVVTAVEPGDSNGDGEVNVSDIVEIVNSILANPSDKFVEAAADMNGDGEVNVTDIVLVVNIIMSANNAKPFGATATETTANDRLLLQTNSDHSLSLCLENEGGYVASQFDITLTDGQELEGVTINSERNNGHVVSYAKTGTDSYRVVVYSLDNQSYNDHSGELLNIAVTGSGSVEVSDIIFVTQNAQERRFAPLYATTTGIRVVGQPDNMQSGDCYDLSGRKLQSSPVNKGIYIINGKKQIVK